MSIKAASLIILNTLVAVMTAWWTLGFMEGLLNSADRPYLVISAGVTAFLASVALIRPILRLSLRREKARRWIGVCLLNVGVVLITHIGVSATLGSRHTWRYHDQMTVLQPDTYTFEVSRWVMDILVFIAGTVFIFGFFTITAGILVAVAWLLRFPAPPPAS